MSFWSAVVAITAIIAFTIMRVTRYGASGERHGRARHGHGGADLPSPREEQLAREVEDLRDRIAVLERIATEDRHSRSVATEIESLRTK